MTVSSLASHSVISPNAYYPRAYEITRITPHHTAFVGSADQIAACFASTSRQASCNYAIGNDGEIVCVVQEQNAAWTSANWDNDNRSITVEISDCDYDWNISDEALNAYIDLCVDLIQRYPGLGGSYDYTGDLDGNITFHRWFASTACPGPYLGSDAVQDYIQGEVNRRLHGGGEDDEVKPEDIQSIVNAITFIGEPFNGEGMYYKAHVASIGWQSAIRDGQIAGTTGQGLGIEAIEFMPSKDVNLKVSAYLRDIGWKDYEIGPEGGIVGTTGESRPIEAIKIHAGVNVRYRVHSSNVGWQQWVGNKMEAGVLGEQIEAFQLVARV